MNGWILDLILLAILVLFVLIGRHRGAILTVVDLLGLLIAAAAALFVGKWLAPWAFQTFLRDPLIRSVTDAVANGTGQAAAEKVSEVLRALPEFVLNAADTETLSQQITEALTRQTADGAAWLVDEAVAPLVISLLRVILTVLLTVIFWILIRLLGRALNLISKAPVLNQINKTLGAILGLLQGALLVLLALAVLRLAEPVQKNFRFLTKENIEQSYLFGTVYELNPLAGLLDGAEKTGN